ncbi:MAG: 16S rRNA (cytosine(967)-C(5))-methyltransferase RsmB [Clostridia bacterium]|nr:16S rRNA (cytosine(967)-C(5))-methyltransferase RsmB [Clostridia bacterium]
MTKRVSSARELALQVLLAVEGEGAYAGIALAMSLSASELDKRDKAFVTELVNGVLRRQITLDYLLNLFLKKPVDSLPLPIAEILRLSLYQLAYLEKIPASAAVNEAVELAKRYGHQGTAALVNGVLRNYLRQKEQITFPDQQKEPAKFLAVYYSLPQWIVELLLEQWTLAETEQFCAYQAESHKIIIRTNTLKISRYELCKKLLAAGYIAQPCRYAPDGLELASGAGLFDEQLFTSGLLTIQDESSQLAALALLPQKGGKVIDLCAAPGGKATYLAQLMDNQGQIIACDLHKHRVGLIKENCDRLGTTCVKPLATDGLELPLNYINWADYLLLDAPCSGLGVLSRRADSRLRKEKNDLAELAELSYKLLLAAADYLNFGGIMVYSTCTITKAENEDNIARFLSARADYELIDLPENFPIKQDRRGILQILPQKQGIEGFFIARLRRKV